MAIKQLFCSLGVLVLIGFIAGGASSTDAAQNWPREPLSFPLDVWKTIDTSGNYVTVSPTKKAPAWEGWVESSDKYHQVTRVKLQKDGSKLTFTFGTYRGPDCDDRLPVQREIKGGRCTNGFVDASGKVVIPPIYFRVQPFSGKYAFVLKEKDANWQVIDKSGALKFTIPSEFDVDIAPMATENCLVVAKKKEASDRFGVDAVSGSYNFEKNEFYPLGQHMFIGGVTEGLWEYSTGRPSVSGFMDSHAHVVIPAQFEFTPGFREGLALVLKNNRWGYIDRTGKMVIELPENCSNAESFSEGRAAVAVGGESRKPGYLEVRKGAKWGFIDKTGKFVIPPRFYLDDSDQQPGNRTKFNGGLAPVAEGTEFNHRYGFIDKNGAWKIKPKFKDAHEFIHGLAMVCIGHVGFNKNEWNAKGNTHRIEQFRSFLKQFDFIGMPRNLLIGALGEPNKREQDGDVYVLNATSCANANESVKIHYDNDRVSKFKFIGWERAYAHEIGR